METSSYIALLVFILANVMVAMSGALFRPGAWYASLNKPSWQPPNWLFGPVWSVLYAMIAVSGWFVWLEVGLQGAGLAFAVYAAQLFLNAVWSGLFFGMRRIDLAMLEVILLWLSIVLNIIVFYPISAAAAWLLLPYLLWVSFAAFLNFVMLKLNPREAEEGV